MSNQAAIDLEKQFQDDLAKATALSLEQQALDEYRRNKKYGTNSYERSLSQEYGSNYYSQLRARHLAREGSLDTATAVPRPSPPPLVTSMSQRRHSEVSHAPSLPVAREGARTPTPQSTTVDNDLISWSGSPTGANKPEVQTFEQLIGDLQRLQTINTQAAPTTPIPAICYGQPQYAPVTGAVGMQMVPYMPPTSQQRVPLTNDELQKLYSMPTHQQHIGFRPPTAAIGYYPQYVPGAAAYMPPHYPPPHVYGLQYSPATAAATYQPAPVGSIRPGAGYAPVNNSNSTHVDLSQSPHSSSAPVALYTPNAVHSNAMPSNALAVSVTNNSASSSSSMAARRQTPPVSKQQQLQPQRSGNDLIDLSQEDDSRVSVLEAFDPLLNDEVSKK